MFGTARLIVTADILIGSGRQLGGRTGPREPARQRRRGRDDEALPLGRREPLFEAGAGELGARVGQRGALAAPLTEFTIASDLPKMLTAVLAAGRPSRWVPFGGSVKAPPLLIGEMAVAGS